MIRGVVDTNVMISTVLFTDSTPAKAVYSLAEHHHLLASIDTIEEAHRVIRRRKFDRYFTLSEREATLESLLAAAEKVVVTRSITACRDPSDDKFLELAVNGQADYMITGDEDLLVLDPFRGVRIVTPGDFLDLLGGESET